MRRAHIRREPVALQDVDGNRPIPRLLQRIGEGDDEAGAHDEREQEYEQDFWQESAQV